MPDTTLRQGPLDHLGLAAIATTAKANDGVRLADRSRRRVIELRARPTPAFLEAALGILGVSLPTVSPTTVAGGHFTVFWMGPDRWWIVADETDPSGIPELKRPLEPFHAGVVEIGDSLAVLAVSGLRVRDVLAKGCTLDLHPRAFQAGHIAQTILAKAQIALHQTADFEFDIYVRRSFAEYLWTWLEDAALE